MAVHNASDVVAELRRRLPGVGVKKLHKLLYYCQGHHLGGVGCPLFSDPIEAWDRGPVVATVWRSERRQQVQPGEVAELDQAALNTIGYVISRYGAMTGADLEALTHNEQPWLLADERRQAGGSQLMPEDEMKTFFEAHQPSDESDDDEDFTVDPAVAHAWLSQAPQRRQDQLSRDDRAALLALAQR